MSNLSNSLNYLTIVLTEIKDFAFNRTLYNWDEDDAYLKGNEEFGELSSAILIITGKLPHKELNESSLGEVADNINQVFDLLTFKNTEDINIDIPISFIGSSIYNGYFRKREKLRTEETINNLEKSIKSIMLRVGKLREELFNSNSIKLTIINDLLEIGFYCFFIEQKINIEIDSMEELYSEYMDILNYYLHIKLEKWKKL